MKAAGDRRRLLVLLDRGLAIPSGMVSALQYREMFARRPDYEVSFVTVFEPPSPARARLLAWCSRLRLHALAGWLERRRRRAHDDAIVRAAAACDVVYWVKVPHVELLRRLRALNRPHLLVFISDAHWLPGLRVGGWEHLEEILNLADGVAAENETVAAFARRHNRHVAVVPDGPQVEEFDRWRGQIKKDPDLVVLGWIGSAANASALYAIWEVLEALFARYDRLHLRIVGADGGSLPRFEKVRWSARASYDQEQMIQEVLGMDIGLFPLFDVEESVARGVTKAAIYMSGGVAALCQDLGHNRDLIVDGENGCLAGTPQEWSEKLEWLITHPGERAVMAQRGLETVRQRLSRERCFERLLHAIESVV